MSKFQNLKFEEGKLHFDDNRRLMIAKQKGIVSKTDLRTELQTMSNSLKDSNKTGQIGCAIKMQKAGVFLPAILTSFGNTVKLFDDTYEAFDNDEISEVQFYVVNNEPIKQTYLRPKKAQPEQSFKDFFQKPTKKK